MTVHDGPQPAHSAPITNYPACPVRGGQPTIRKGGYYSLLDGLPLAADGSDGRGKLGEYGTPAFAWYRESGWLVMAEGCPGWKVWVDGEGVIQKEHT